MTGHPVKILECSYINHDVKRFVIEKPEGYTFIPGHATMVSIDLPEWREQLRPFTFTSLNEWPYLEFTIKIYENHHGVTEQLGRTNAGATLLIHEVFGTIDYKGPGVFIAAGAGITPFIAILRDLFNRQMIAGNKLILSNKTSADLIYGKELYNMLGADFINVFTREGVIGFRERRIDRNFLIEMIHDFSGNFYVCGPDDFVGDITGFLLSLGATAGSIVFEQ